MEHENQILLGDCLDRLKDLPDNSVDLLCTDPPYAISFMGREWDKALPSIGIWRECLRVLKPGAFAFIMSSPRQDVLSQMIVRIGAAGFDTDFTSIYWTYASGFPKAFNVGKTTEDDELRGAYGGFQPKPAVEVIIVAMKPLSEKTFVDQALKNGKGITWLHDAMIPFRSPADLEKAQAKNPGKDEHFTSAVYGGDRPQQLVHESGRFPANLLVSDDALNDGRVIKSTGPREHDWTEQNNTNATHITRNINSGSHPNDSGSYSRYFNLDIWWEERVKQLPAEVQGVFPFLIVPKASAREKAGAKHPTVKPIKLIAYLVTLGSRPGDLVLDPFVGSGTTPIACKLLNRKYVAIEKDPDNYREAVERVAKLNVLAA